MEPTPYKIHKVMRQLSTGSTKPFACAVSAVLKYDCDESPQNVYNELVAIRLAQALHIPIANGVLTDQNGTDHFASLYIGRSNEKLPPLRSHQIKAVAYRYQDEVAALTAFDIFIGNRDRRDNIIASIVSEHRIFGGIDHGMSLLSVEESPEKSLNRLGKGELIVEHHPFYRYVNGNTLKVWADRIAAIDPTTIRECCRCSKTIGSVSIKLQDELAEALLKRQKYFPLLIITHLKRPIAAV